MNKNFLVGILFALAISVVSSLVPILGLVMLAGCFIAYIRFGLQAGLITVGLFLIVKLGIVVLFGDRVSTENNGPVLLKLDNLVTVVTVLVFSAFVLLPKKWSKGTRVVSIAIVSAVLSFALTLSGLTSVLEEIKKSIVDFVKVFSSYTSKAEIETVLTNEIIANIAVMMAIIIPFISSLITLFASFLAANLMLRRGPLSSFMIGSRLSPKIHFASLLMAVLIVFNFLAPQIDLVAYASIMMLDLVLVLYAWQGLVFIVEYARSKDKIQYFRMAIPITIAVSIVLQPVLLVLCGFLVVLGIVSFFIRKPKIDVTV